MKRANLFINLLGVIGVIAFALAVVLLAKPFRRTIRQVGRTVAEVGEAARTVDSAARMVEDARDLQTLVFQIVGEESVAPSPDPVDTGIELRPMPGGGLRVYMDRKQLIRAGVAFGATLNDTLIEVHNRLQYSSSFKGITDHIFFYDSGVQHACGSLQVNQVWRRHQLGVSISLGDFGTSDGLDETTPVAEWEKSLCYRAILAKMKEQGICQPFPEKPWYFESHWSVRCQALQRGDGGTQ